MNANSADLNAARQSLFLEQMVEDFSCQMTPEQRMLLGILAVESEHGVDAGSLLKAFAKETRSAKTASFAAASRAGGKPDEANRLLRRLIPSPLAKTMTAMSPMQRSDFFRGWLAHSTYDEANVVQHEQTITSRAIRLVLKVWFFGVILSFIGAYILPEFKKMGDEFGMERFGEFPLLTSLVIFFGYVSAILSLLIVVLLILFLFMRNSRFLIGYLKRWNPWNWRQVSLSTKTRKQMALSWRIQGVAFGAAAKRGIDWAEQVENGTLSTDQANAISRLGDRETQAWLVSNVARSGRFVGEDRRGWLFQLLVTAVHIILTVAVFVVAWSFLNFLLTVMSTVGNP